MESLKFTKAEAAKNDFVIIHDPDREITTDSREAISRYVCHRRVGVGADGTIYIEQSERCDFGMAFHNPDGSYGSMCGNGGRAAALYAHSRGLASPDMTFESLGSVYRAEVRASEVRLHFPPPAVLKTLPGLKNHRFGGPLFFADTGAPHLVLFLDAMEEAPESIEALDMERVGRSLRHADEFKPIGANINVLAGLPDGSFRVRTYEKGVEAETMACGTGALASGIAAHAARNADIPVRLRTQGGDTLIVAFETEGNGGGDRSARFQELRIRNLSLEGPARLVFDGVLDLSSRL